LLVRFDDESSIVFTVAMYGGIWAYCGALDNPYHRGSLNSLSPLDDTFDESFFDKLLGNEAKDFSAKAFLATEQRIPGLGNGVLQDILFNAAIHPKQKKSTFTDTQRANLFRSIKSTLHEMTINRGRDTEKDFMGNSGGYKTMLSKNTVGKPCTRCGNTIVKEAYLGGAVYFCPGCQIYRK
jgi:formamidopyrimidine-DNA glycosylase